MGSRPMPDDIGNVPEHVPSRASRHSTSPMEEAGRLQATLRRVDVFRLLPHRLQPVERHAPEQVSDLMESIAAHGLLQAPLAARLGKGRDVIIAGHRRVRACQILALDGRLGDGKIPVYIRTDLSEEQIIYMICGEALHRRDFSAVHEAEVVGRSWHQRSQELGRDATLDDMVDIVPRGRTSISEALTIYQALGDPRLETLVRQADEAGKTLLVKTLRAADFSTMKSALKSFQEGGVPAMRRALAPKRTGRPEKTVVRRKRGDDDFAYDLTVRVRQAMDDEALDEATEALRQTLEDLESMRTSRQRPEGS